MLSSLQFFNNSFNYNHSKIIKNIYKIKNFFDYNLNEINYVNNISLLEYIISIDDISLIKKALTENKIYHFNFVTHDKRSILYKLIKFGKNDMLKLILEKDKEIIGISILNITDISDYIPIAYSIFYNEDIIDYFKNTDFMLKNSDNSTLLDLCVINNKIKSFKYILNNIYNFDILNSQDTYGNTILHYIVLNYMNSYFIDEILHYSDILDFNIVSYNTHLTPLNLICYEQKFFLVSKFIKYSDVNISDINGNNCLYYSISNYSIFNKLFPRFTYFNNINTDGQTLCHKLLYYFKSNYNILNKYNIKKLLNNTNLNIQDNSGNSIVHLLSMNNIISHYLPELKNKFINHVITNNNNKTILDYDSTPIFINLLIDYYKNNFKLSSSDSEIKELLINNKYINNIILFNEISFHSINNKDYTTFGGLRIDTLSGLLFLHQKYNKILASPLNIIKYLNPSNEYKKYLLDLNLYITDNWYSNIGFEWNYQHFFKFDPFIDMFKITNSYFMIPIFITENNKGHLNILLFNKEKNEIERFEPNGIMVNSGFNYNFRKLDFILKNLFKNYTYIPPNQFLPFIGLYSYAYSLSKYKEIYIEPAGFCVIWCIIWIDLRLSHPNMSRSDIYFNFISKLINSKIDIKNILLDYSNKITDLRDNILKKLHTNMIEWINNINVKKVNSYFIDLFKSL